MGVSLAEVLFVESESCRLSVVQSRKKLEGSVACNPPATPFTLPP